MAGLAATLNAPGRVDALTAALVERGADAAVCQLTGSSGARLEIGVRAVLPMIARVAGERGILAAFAVDGVASATALDAGFAADGPVGLLAAGDPCAVVLADVERGELVLARAGDGPCLYYARYKGGWVVASEPSALVDAGVPARPDADVIRRFVVAGACDDSAATFFAAIRRVQSDEAVVLAGDGTAHVVHPQHSPQLAGSSEPDRPHKPAVPPGAVPPGAVPPAAVPPGAAVPPDAVRASSAPAPSPATSEYWLPHLPAPTEGRLGVLLAAGLPGAAVLGTALAQSARTTPLPIRTVIFPSMDGPPAHPPAVLVPLPRQAVEHIPYLADLAAIDLDRFLREMGEPVTDLDLYFLWAVVKDGRSEVDILVDASLGDPACVPRVCDRLLARYGVAVRCPLRGVASADFAVAAGRTLPAAAARYAAKDWAGSIDAADFILSHVDEVAAALARPRPWRDPSAGVEALRRLTQGGSADAEALLRAYLVERWLATVDDEEGRGAVDEFAVPPDVQVNGGLWARIPVRTPVFAAGDELAAPVAWHVAEAMAALRAIGMECWDRPWFVAVSAKVVAVAQARLTPVWQVKPGAAARVLARLARNRVPRLGAAWTVQVGMADGGRLRIIAGILVAALGLTRLARRILPYEAALLSPVRADAVPPADAAVVHSPFQPDDAAQLIGDALRYALEPELLDTLAGCAVATVDGEGSVVLGFAAGPHLDAVPHAEQVVARLLADNPCGQGRQQTPIVLALQTTGAPGAGATTTAATESSSVTSASSASGAR